MSDFQSDLLIFSTNDGGEILLDDNNLFQNDTGFDSMIYICLFGGNELDNGSEATKKFEFWGNKIEKNNPERRITSQFQNIIKGYPATPGNLNRVKEAAKQDLQVMISEGIIDTLNINASIPAKNRLNVEIEGIKDKKKIVNTRYELNWLSKL